MHRRITILELAPFLREFSEKHRAQPMTLEVLSGAIWKIEESGMPLLGLDLDTKAVSAPVVQIMLGDNGAGDGRHLFHTVGHVKSVTVELNKDEEEQRVVIEDGDGAQAVLSIGD